MSSTCVDNWDNHSDASYLNLPARTFAQAMSNETDTLTITRKTEGGKEVFWLLDSNCPGQTQYDSLVEAKRAGAAIFEHAEKKAASDIAVEVGLDPAVWVFNSPTASFRPVVDPTLASIFRPHMQEGGWWEVHHWEWANDDTMGGFETAGDAADAYLSEYPLPGAAPSV